MFKRKVLQKLVSLALAVLMIFSSVSPAALFATGTGDDESIDTNPDYSAVVDESIPEVESAVPDVILETESFSTDVPQFYLDDPIIRRHTDTPRNFRVGDASALLGECALRVAGIRLYASVVYPGFTGAIAPVFGPSGNPLGMNIGNDPEPPRSETPWIHDIHPDYSVLTYLHTDAVFNLADLANERAQFVVDVFWTGGSGYIETVGFTFLDVNGDVVIPLTEPGPPGAVTGVTIFEDDFSLTETIGTYQLTAIVRPFNAINQAVVWTSSDEAVATVDETGLVTARSPGVAVITVTTEDGGFTHAVTVTVNPQLVEFDGTSFQLNPARFMVGGEFVFDAGSLLGENALAVAGIRIYANTESGSLGGAISYGGAYTLMPDGQYGANTLRWGLGTAWPVALVDNTSMTFPAVNNHGNHSWDRTPFDAPLFTQADLDDGTAVFYLAVWWVGPLGINVTGFTFLDVDGNPIAPQSQADAPQFYLDEPLARRHTDSPRPFRVGDAPALLGECALRVAGIRVYASNVYPGFNGGIAPILTPSESQIDVGMQGGWDRDSHPDYAFFTYLHTEPVFGLANLANGNAQFVIDVFWTGSGDLTVVGFTFLDVNGEVVVPLVPPQPPAPATGMMIYDDDFALTAGVGTYQLTTIFTPFNAINRNVMWESSNEAVASVSEDGFVTALTPGTAVITATAEDGGFTDTVTVTVNAQRFEFDGESFHLDPYRLMRGGSTFVIDAGNLLREAALDVAGIRIYANTLDNSLGGAISYGGPPQTDMPGYGPNTLRWAVAGNWPILLEDNSLTFPVENHFPENHLWDRIPFDAPLFTQEHLDSDSAVFYITVWWAGATGINLTGFTFLDVDGNPIEPAADSGGGIPELPSIPEIPSIPELPSIPGLPSTPELPSIPELPGIPELPSILELPSTPGLPSVPDLPGIPALPSIPALPGIPSVPEISRIPTIPPAPVLRQQNQRGYQVTRLITMLLRPFR